jgi:hypothetical protein
LREFQLSKLKRTVKNRDKTENGKKAGIATENAIMDGKYMISGEARIDETERV